MGFHFRSRYESFQSDKDRLDRITDALIKQSHVQVYFKSTQVKKSGLYLSYTGLFKKYVEHFLGTTITTKSLSRIFTQRELHFLKMAVENLVLNVKIESINNQDLLKTPMKVPEFIQRFRKGEYYWILLIHSTSLRNSWIE